MIRFSIMFWAKVRVKVRIKVRVRIRRSSNLALGLSRYSLSKGRTNKQSIETSGRKMKCKSGANNLWKSEKDFHAF